MFQQDTEQQKLIAKHTQDNPPQTQSNTKKRKNGKV